MRPERKYTGDIYELIFRACTNIERLRSNLHWVIEINTGFEKEHKYALLPVTMDNKLRSISSELYDISNEVHHIREALKEALE